jgi:hypothetical protein
VALPPWLLFHPPERIFISPSWYLLLQFYIYKQYKTLPGLCIFERKLQFFERLALKKLQ